MHLHQLQEFSQLIRQTAERKPIAESIVEKDYWVTLVLQELQNSEFSGKFIFKGGTSLSKGWNLIERFSDDIDLLITTHGLGERAQTTELKKFEAFVASINGLELDLDNKDSTSGPGHRTSCYNFPRASASPIRGMRPYIRLEMSFRAGSEPSTTRPIQSMVAREIEAAGNTTIADNIRALNMPVLDIRRTFIEKLYAIYAICETGEIAGKSRHYYDIFQLLSLPEIQTFIGSDEYERIKEDVAMFSLKHFPKVPLPPDNRILDSKAINPPADLGKIIGDDIAASEIYFNLPPSFEEIVLRIATYKEKL